MTLWDMSAYRIPWIDSDGEDHGGRDRRISQLNKALVAMESVRCSITQKQHYYVGTATLHDFIFGGALQMPSLDFHDENLRSGLH